MHFSFDVIFICIGLKYGTDIEEKSKAATDPYYTRREIKLPYNFDAKGNPNVP